MTTNVIAFDPCLHFDPATVVLSCGSHRGDFVGDCCLVEAANQATVCCPALAEQFGKAEQFDDDHPSISRVVRSFAIGLNDAWTADSWMAKHPDDWKRLLPYVTSILGTKTTAKDETTRAWMATDWLARVYTPTWLRLAGLAEHAQLLEGLARIVDAETSMAAQSTLGNARAAAGDAAWDAAGAAAGDAAGAALYPTVRILQDSALVLFDEMIAVGRARA
jgi:hypothetical protein